MEYRRTVDTGCDTSKLLEYLYGPMKQGNGLMDRFMLYALLLLWAIILLGFVVAIVFD
jgi:hypothetical protein